MNERACIVCILAFLSALLLVMPVCEIAYGSLHRADTTCNNDDVITPAHWLMVSGIVGVFSLIVVGGAFYQYAFRDKALCKLFFYFAFAVVRVFGGIWSIVGAVMLWRDNLDCPRGGYRNFIWASVIIHLFFTLLSCFGDNKPPEEGQSAHV